MKRAALFAAGFALTHVAVAVVEGIRFRRMAREVNTEAARILREWVELTGGGEEK